MPKKDIIVIGASTGGIEAIKTLVADLPPDLPASIFVVIHIGAYGLGVLPEIFARAGALPASNAQNWERFKPGRIYVAPADHHLVLDPRGYTRVTRGPKENRSRPAVDPLFRSAAAAFGPRVIGAVLTGYLDDGTAGLWAVKERGGTAIVQHPDDAIARSMPESAAAHVNVDYCVPIKELGALLTELAGAPAEWKGATPMTKQMETEIQIAQEDTAMQVGIMSWGEPSVFACPECHGVLLQLKEGSNIRFRCHTGHAFSVETLLADFTDHTEDALWNAIRCIEESVLLMRNMAAQFERHQHGATAEALRKKADEAEKRADLVRSAAMQQEKASPRNHSDDSFPGIR